MVLEWRYSKDTFEASQGRVDEFIFEGNDVVSVAQPLVGYMTRGVQEALERFGVEGLDFFPMSIGHVDEVDGAEFETWSD